VAVLVEDGRVVAVGGLAELTARGTRGVQVDRYPGGTISPGLIDAHVHLTMPGDGTAYEPAAGAPAATRLALAVANLRAHLAAGVTTVRDLGSHLDLLAWTPDAAYALPRLLRAGPPVTTAGGHMRLFGGEVADAAGAARLAHRNLDAGADVIKIVASGGGTVGTVPHEASLDRAVIATAVDAAHTRHRRATTHAMSNASIRRAVEAGTDGVEHLAFLTPDGASGFDADVAELAVARRVVFGSTLGVNHAYIAAAERGDLDPYELDAQRERTASYVRNAALLRAAGALIVPASDSGWKHTRFGGFATELRLLAAAGYPPIEVLRLATSFAAAYVGLGDQVGALAPGLRADIAVFDGDPARDITRTAAVRAVYRDGLRVSTGQR
jgi:imidazolonepropionase-like amidohydrolase